ncbi:SDR family NAD(P)-dependent oxidoreductase [Streptomyces parvus]|uniref:SDR family NAD(P)-dependent oxidoreductase n=1 Tax=Streptomyces parvus TaxID=66428 RepID=UPI0033FC1D33
MRDTSARTAPPTVVIPLSALTEAQLDDTARNLLAFLADESGLDLTDLAFSLQVGRAALDFRLSFVADSLDAVADGLVAHLRGSGATGLFRGRVPEPLSWEQQDEEQRELIGSLTAAGDLAGVARAWAGGTAVDWPRLYAPHRPYRVPLPTYPFAKERYWVSPRPESPATAAGAGDAAALGQHPLLHRADPGAGPRRHTSTFTGAEPVLASHRVRGVRMLPGAAYLEMALAALADVDGTAPAKGAALTDVVWVRPFGVGELPRDLHLELRPGTAGAFRFEALATDTGDGGTPGTTGPVVHCTGTIAPHDTTVAPLDLARLRGECAERRLDAPKIYAAFHAAGIEYGDAFRGIVYLLVGRDQVLARLELPEAARADTDAYRLHPSLMDAALQTLVGLTGPGSDASGETLVPYGAEHVEVLGTPSAVRWVWARPTAPDGRETPARRFDLDLCDDAGEVHVRVRGFEVRPLPRPAAPAGTATDSAAPGTGQVLAVPYWREAALPPPAPGARRASRAVVFAEAGLLPEGTVSGPDDEVLTLASPASTPDARYTDYALQVFDRTRELLGDGTLREATVQILLADLPDSRLGSGLGALLRTAALENPRITGQVVLMAAETPAEERAALLARERLHGADGTVRHRGGRREVLSWREELAADRVGTPWRAGGVYLITGGLGGLGRIVAEEIVEQVRDATLVLVGRSPETERSRRTVEQLRGSGARVSYVPLDVTDPAAVQALVDRILGEHRALHGVIHAAGVIEDDFILRKSARTFRAVLAPKVSGLVHLDRATGHVDLDFFVAFSSGSAVTGNVGQADYAAANAFMDAYAEYRQDLVAAGQRRGRSLSVDWPLWAEGGMRADAGAEAMLRDRYGIALLERADGLRALDGSLRTDHHQVLVAAGDVARIKNALTMYRAGEDTGPVSTDIPREASQGLDEALTDRTITYVTSLLSGVLKVPAHRIDAGLPLERYGIDSVMALNLTAQLETVFGTLPKTLFFEYRDIKALSRYFLDAHGGRLRELLGDTPAPMAPAAAEAPPAADAPEAATAPGPRSAAVTAPGRSVNEVRGADIAVIGLGGRYPQASNLREFWRNLAAGRDSVTEVPGDRWDHSAYYDADRSKPGTTHSKWGGFLDDADCFDPLFFAMSPREAEITDPQERLFLECVYETLQDAGYTCRDAAGRHAHGIEGDVGVFVGAMYDEYQLYGATEQAVADGQVIPGNAANIANRVSYFCDWHGPSMTVKTMCSSSLTALHLACQSLQLGDCDVAVAGGVNLSLHPNKYLLLGQTGFVSSRGRCESFGRGGDGYVPGEGVGAVLLKPLDRAVADNDQIYGVIKATALNHGGRTNGYTVPDPNAQSRVIARALDRAGVDARTVSYVEAHGTGTSLGDPIEIAGLTKAFSRHTDERQYCAIGSVKSNIGHAESAAGISALTKVLLQMRHGRLVPSLHSEVLNPHIDFTETPFRVQRELTEWRRPVLDTPDGPREYPRIAGVSSFGAGGSNAHVVVEEYVPAGRPETADPARWPLASVVVLSARTADQLREQARRLLEWAQEEGIEDADVPGIALTLQVGREHMDERLAFVVGSAAELMARLREHADGKDGAEVFRGRIRRAEGAVSFLADDEDMAHTIEAWVRKGKFGKLLELWVNGLAVPWRRSYPDPLPDRVSLPTYPFARKRFWLPTGAPATVASDRRPQATATATGPAPATAETRPAAPVLTAPAAAPAEAGRVVGKPSGIGLAPLGGGSGTTRPAPAPVAAPAPERRPASVVALTPVGAEEPAPTASAASPAIATVPVAAAPAPAPEQLIGELAASLAEALYMAEEDVDPDTNFTDLGLDSIVGVEWVKAINKRFGLDLAATRLYDTPTVRQLADHLSTLLPAGAAPAAPVAPTAPAGPSALASTEEPAAGTGGTAAPAGPSAPEIQAELLSTLAEALYLGEDELDLDRNFTDFGLDSIVGVEWIKVINKRFGLDLAATRLYDHPTVLKLTACVLKELEKGGAPQGRPFRELTESDPTAAQAPTAAPAPEPVVVREPVAAAVPAAAEAPAFSPAREAAPRHADAIAVVGMSGRYPRSEGLDEYWDNLAAGRDCVREIPKSRWDVDAYFDPRPGQKGKVYCRRIGDLDDIDVFDPLFFQIPPAEAESMDPQQRLFLQEAYHAFEDAGYDPRSLSGDKCGVYLGIMSNEYSVLMQKQGGESSAAATSNSNAITAARIAYFLNLKGPAIALDTACSSSLVATHLATQALRNGEIDMALVGGVTLYLGPEAYISMCGAGMLSPEGRCKTFDDSADGFVPGEGVGALVLKRLEDAVRDGDHIHGVVVGSGINQDGRTNGITAPSAVSQTELVRDIYARHGIDPGGVGYVEMHGTGTKLGDPIELEALATVYRERTDRTGYCAIGSVKSNLGHTSAAAGMASVQKALLCMRHEQLVPTLHFERPNEHFGFDDSPFYVNTELKPWKTEPGARRRAAVSGFGFSGTNAHLVLEEYVPEDEGGGDVRRVEDAAGRQAGKPRVFVLSARSEEQLRTSAGRLGRHLRANPGHPPADVAHTLQRGREAMAWRLAAVAATTGDLAERLSRYAEDGRADGVLVGQAVRSRTRGPRELPGTGPDGTLSVPEAERLAAAWVGGTPVDWAALYPDARPGRVPLPTYPFARESYWFTTEPDSESAPVPAAPVAVPAAPVAAAHGSGDAQPTAPAASAGTNILLKPVWDAVPRPVFPAPAAPSGRVVVIGGTPERVERIRAVHPGLEHLSPDAADTVETLTARLDAPGEPIGHLVWLAVHASSADATGDAVIEAQETGLYACFRTLKALLSLEYGRRALDVTLVTERSLRVRRSEVVDPTHAGLHGLLGSVAKEYPGWNVRLADLDPDRAWPLPELFALPCEERGSVWAHRRGRWYRQGLLTLQGTAAEPAGRPVYRQGGTYVVVGGAGGIGEAWTEHMVRTYGAHIVWIGRREEDTPIREKLRRLGDLGPEPRYVRADAADRASLERVYEEIKRTHPVVHGVIHSAIVLLDQSLERMDEERFRAAVTAKVDVSVRLAQVFGSEPLDFLVFFSSMNSFLKAPGQSNYVAGSVFEDAYAHRLATELSVPVRTMNWGYWGSVGIVASPEYQERMNRAGAASIEPADGMAALDTLLTGSFDQLGLVKAHGGNA